MYSAVALISISLNVTAMIKTAAKIRRPTKTTNVFHSGLFELLLTANSLRCLRCHVDTLKVSTFPAGRSKGRRRCRSTLYRLEISRTEGPMKHIRILGFASLSLIATGAWANGPFDGKWSADAADPW
jgi:hypothetical protein